MKLVILGGGESGVGTALLGKQKGYEVFLSDAGTIKDHYKAELNKAGIDWEEKQHSVDRILEADVVMKSPGIPDKVQIVKDIKEKNIPIISEIEFAYPFAKNISIYA